MEGGVLLWDLAKADLVVSGRRDTILLKREKGIFLAKALDGCPMQPLAPTPLIPGQDTPNISTLCLPPSAPFLLPSPKEYIRKKLVSSQVHRYLSGADGWLSGLERGLWATGLPVGPTWASDLRPPQLE